MINKLIASIGAIALTGTAFASYGENSGYFEANGMLASISSKSSLSGGSDSETGTYFGGSAELGKTFAHSDFGFHQAGLEIGFLQDSAEEPGLEYDNRMLTGLFTYNYNFNLSSDFGYIYVGPSLGMTHFNADYTTSGGVKSSFSDIAPAFGAQAGLRVNLNRDAYFHVGYRVLKIADMEGKAFGNTVRVTDILAHEFRIGVTFMF